VRGLGVQRAGRLVRACCAWRDLQTPTQVGACAGRTPPPSQRGERRRDRIGAHGPPEIALDPPQRDDEARLDAKALPDLLQKPPIVGEVAPRIVNPLLRHDLVEIFGKGHLVLGLLAVELDDMRQVLDGSESDIDRRRPDALQSGIAPYPGEKTRKIAFRRRSGPAPQRDRQQRSRGEQCPAAHAERHHHCAPANTVSPPLSAINL